jgi:hypothetical protein
MRAIHYLRLHDCLLKPDTGILIRLEKRLDSDGSSILGEVLELYLGLSFIASLLDIIFYLFLDDMESVDSRGVFLRKIFKVNINQIIETYSGFTNLLICDTIHYSQHNLLLIVTNE